jgi:hypothetical protein
LAVTDEIVDLYSSVLNGCISRYAGIVGAPAIDLLVKPALQRAQKEHKFLEAVEVKGGRLVAKELSADIEVLKSGFDTLTKAIVDSLAYVFGPDEVIPETRRIYAEISKSKQQLIQDAKIAKGLPAFLSEESWEEV